MHGIVLFLEKGVGSEFFSHYAYTSMFKQGFKQKKEWLGSYILLYLGDIMSFFSKKIQQNKTLWLDLPSRSGMVYKLIGMQ